MIFQIIAAIIGTFSFSVLFSIPLEYTPYCAMSGGISWLVYLISTNFCTPTISTLVASMVVVFISRILAVYKKSPATLYLIAGIFPLVPGAGIYWTTYYLVNNDLLTALNTGYSAVKTAMALVLGIVFVFEIPQQFFNRLFKQ